jgi:hypothetical protein
MSKDQGIAAAILVGGVAVLIVYTWQIYAYALMVLQIVAFAAKPTAFA